MRPVLFIDFDGTLCHDRFWRSLDKESYEQVQKFLFTDNKNLVGDWMRGTYTSKEVNEKIAAELDLDFDSLWRIFVDDCRTMHVDQEALHLIEAFKKRYTVALITDNMDCFTEFTVPALSLSRYFDHILNSADTKLFKEENNGQQFIAVANHSRAQISECMLIDNSKRTCDFFQSLGGKSYFVGQETTLRYWLEKLQ